jgi:hypothetical protein
VIQLWHEARTFLRFEFEQNLRNSEKANAVQREGSFLSAFGASKWHVRRRAVVGCFTKAARKAIHCAHSPWVRSFEACFGWLLLFLSLWYQLESGLLLPLSAGRAGVATL